MSLAAIRIRCPITAHFVTDPSTFLIALHQHFVVTACSRCAMQGTCLSMQPHVPQPAWQGASQLLPAHRTGGRQEAGRVKHRVLVPASGTVFFKHCSVTCLPFIIKSTSGCTKRLSAKLRLNQSPPVQHLCRAQRGSSTLLLSPGRVGCRTPACPAILCLWLPGFGPFPCIWLLSPVCVLVALCYSDVKRAHCHWNASM